VKVRLAGRVCVASKRKEILMPHLRRLRFTVLAGLVAALALVPGVAPALEVGEKAPDFTLAGPGNKPVKLSELLDKGPVVIYTFIQAFTAT